MIPSTPPASYVALLAVEYERLGRLLRSLDATDWERPTVCEGWTVHDLALHLLGGLLGVTSFHRDGHRPAPPAGLDEAGFIAWLDALQAEWVDGARRISPELTIELIEWIGPRAAAAMGRQDPTARTASVSWASTEPVPLWLDHARELTRCGSTASSCARPSGSGATSRRTWPAPCSRR